MKMHHYKPEHCIDCACCDERNLKCYPGSRDCASEYDLTPEDLVTPMRCDFFKSKQSEE